METRSLLVEARRLARRYRESVADLVAVLAEIERLRLYAQAGYPTLFAYCVKDLSLSEDDAYKLIQSARASRKRPEILSFLADGSLTPRAVALLAPQSGAADFTELLDRAKGQSIREVEKLVASRHEAPQMPDRIKPLGTSETPTLRYRFEFSADEPLRDLVERVKGLLRHRHPEGRLEDVVREGLTALLLEMDPLERDAAAARPGGRSNPWARRVPPAVRDEVWRRDGGRCAFVGPSGRCESTSWLEVDHIVPWSLGGRSDDPANLRLLCRAHNHSEARRLGVM